MSRWKTDGNSDNYLARVEKEQRETHEEIMRSDRVTLGHVNRRNNGEGTTLMKGLTTGRPGGGLNDQSLRKVMKEGINPRVGRTRAIITGLRTLRRWNFDNTCVMSSKSKTR